jgi:hypothetical protein
MKTIKFSGFKLAPPEHELGGLRLEPSCSVNVLQANLKIKVRMFLRAVGTTCQIHISDVNLRRRENFIFYVITSHILNAGDIDGK